MQQLFYLVLKSASAHSRTNAAVWTDCLPVDPKGHLLTLDIEHMNDGVWCLSVVFQFPLWSHWFLQKIDVFSVYVWLPVLNLVVSKLLDYHLAVNAMSFGCSHVLFNVIQRAFVCGHMYYVILSCLRCYCVSCEGGNRFLPRASQFPWWGLLPVMFYILPAGRWVEESSLLPSGCCGADAQWFRTCVKRKQQKQPLCVFPPISFSLDMQCTFR